MFHCAPQAILHAKIYMWISSQSLKFSSQILTSPGIEAHTKIKTAQTKDANISYCHFPYAEI